MRMGAPTRRVQHPPQALPDDRIMLGGSLVNQRNQQRPPPQPQRQILPPRSNPQTQDQEVVLRKGVSPNGDEIVVVRHGLPGKQMRPQTKGAGSSLQPPILDVISNNSGLPLHNANTRPPVQRRALQRVPATLMTQGGPVGSVDEDFERELLAEVLRIRADQRHLAHSSMGRAAMESQGFMDLGLVNLHRCQRPSSPPHHEGGFPHSPPPYQRMICYKAPSDAAQKGACQVKPHTTQIVINPHLRVGDGCPVTRPRSRSHRRSATPGSVTSSVALVDMMHSHTLRPHHMWEEDDDDSGVDLFTPIRRSPPPGPLEVPDGGASVFNPLSQEGLEDSVRYWRTHPFTSSSLALKQHHHTTTMHRIRPAKLTFPHIFLLTCPITLAPRPAYKRQMGVPIGKIKTPVATVVKTPRTSTHLIAGGADIERQGATETPTLFEEVPRRIPGKKTPRDETRYNPEPEEHGKRHLLLPRLHFGGLAVASFGNPTGAVTGTQPNTRPPLSTFQSCGRSELKRLGVVLAVTGEKSSRSLLPPLSPICLPLTDSQLESALPARLQRRLQHLSNRVSDARDGAVSCRVLETSLLQNLEALQQSLSN